jgi:hypothetical protein
MNKLGLSVRFILILLLMQLSQVFAQLKSAASVWLEVPDLQVRVEENGAQFLPATAHVGYVRVHLSRQPQDVSYGSVTTRLNAEVANIVTTQRSTSEGIVCDVDLTRNPMLALHPGRNSLEITFRDRWNQSHYAAFLLELPSGKHYAPSRPDLHLAAGGQRYAIVVGVAHYKFAGSGLQNLAYADSDAAAFRDFLLLPHGGNFRATNVRFLLNEDATLDNVKVALTRFLAQAHPEDTVVLYLNLHGGYDPGDPQNKYLLTYDSDPRDMANSALAVTELPNLLSNYVNTKHIVTFADSCHSLQIGEAQRTRVKPANLVNQYLVRAAEVSGLAAIEASDIGETSGEGHQWEDHGVFTYYLLKGLSGEADQNHDGTVSARELFSYVQQQVSKATHDTQLPISAIGWKDDVALAGVLTAGGGGPHHSK